jgi:hypothetical protein
MGIDYTEWHRREIEKAERTHAEHLARHDRSFYGCLAKADHDEDDGGGSATDHHASKVADLLVEAGSHSDRASALAYLLHNSHGQALLNRMHKAADQTAKDPPMDTVYSIMKAAAGGIAGVCAAIVAKGSTSLTELEIVEAATAVASERYPGLTKAQSFDRVYSDPGDEGRLLRSACSIAKAAEFAVAGLPVQVVGGADAQDVDDPSAAIEALHELGRKLYPQLTEAQAFEKVFSDPKHAALAARAHRRPAATTFYPMPR